MRKDVACNVPTICCRIISKKKKNNTFDSELARMIILFFAI